MKLQAFTIKIGLVVAMAIFGVGCAKKSDGGSSASDNTTATGTVPTTPRDTGSDRGADWNIGATAPLAIDSMAALNYYVAVSAINNPTDVQISVKLQNVGSTVLGQNKTPGQIFISYYDNGQYHTGKFYTLDKTNPTGNLSDSGTFYPGWHHGAYNTWFKDPRTGKLAFHGFYQDNTGAVMIIIDNLVDLGDGAGANTASGSIWFKNYAQSSIGECQGATYKCQTLWDVPGWFRIAGPYDVRTFLENASVGTSGDGNLVTTSVLYPSESHFYTNLDVNPYVPVEPARGWRRLGTFTGLNKAKAFSE